MIWGLTMISDRLALWLVLTWLLTAAACGSSSRDAAPDGSVSSGETGVAHGPIVFQDDFSDPASGWQRENEDYQETDYDEGAFRIFFKDTNLVTRVPSPAGEVEDGVMEVDVTPHSGTGGTYGLYARYSGESLVRCLINDEGKAALDLARYEEYALPAPELEVNPAVKAGASNHIALRFVGKEVACYVNDVLIQTLTDESPVKGDCGLIATNDDAGLDVRFDNFVLARP
jgi:hypothetical protein